MFFRQTEAMTAPHYRLWVTFLNHSVSAPRSKRDEAGQHENADGIDNLTACRAIPFLGHDLHCKVHVRVDGIEPSLCQHSQPR